MLSIEQARKIEPELNNLSDEAVLEIIENMKGFAQLAFEKWSKEKDGSKNLTRVLLNSD